MGIKPSNCFNVLPKIDCCFGIDDYKDKKYFAIRMWVERKDGTWIPTQKGVNVELKYWDSFSKAIEVLDKEINFK